MRFPNNQKGISIVEVIVSIFIIGFVLSIFSASLISFKVNRENQNKALAYNFAQSELGALKKYPFEKLTNRVDADFVGLAYNYGQQKVTSDAGAISPPQVLAVSPSTHLLAGNISSLVLLPDGYYDNFTFSARVKILSSSGTDWQVGTIFRKQDIENYYYFSVTKDGLSLKKLVMGAATTLYSESRVFNFDTWYNLKVITLTDAIQIYIDDSLAASVTDNAFMSGFLGIAGLRSAAYYLDDVHLDAAVGNGDWPFDADLVGTFPQGFLSVYPTSLSDCQGKLTVENYNGLSTIKKITAKVIWQEGEAAKEVSLSTLRRATYE